MGPCVLGLCFSLVGREIVGSLVFVRPYPGSIPSRTRRFNLNS
jgi:hypothetical protein